MRIDEPLGIETSQHGHEVTWFLFTVLPLLQDSAEEHDLLVGEREDDGVAGVAARERTGMVPTSMSPNQRATWQSSFTSVSRNPTADWIDARA
jgi:hypothetical protein